MMEFLYSKELYSCVYSFVPFCLSIPFLFVHFLHRISLLTCLSLIVLLFLVHFLVFKRFFVQQVFVRAHALTFLLTISVLWAFSSPAIGLFTAVLSLFHLSEYISVGLWCPRTLALNSFLLDHSFQYHAAICLAYFEYFLEKFYFFPNGIFYDGIWLVVGLAMVVTGECLRKLAMNTAQQNFSHVIQDKPNKEHRLITTGIYEHFRHPSYVGWLCWACGTQVLLANPICFVIYLCVRPLS